MSGITEAVKYFKDDKHNLSILCDWLSAVHGNYGRAPEKTWSYLSPASDDCRFEDIELHALAILQHSLGYDWFVPKDGETAKTYIHRLSTQVKLFVDPLMQAFLVVENQFVKSGNLSRIYGFGEIVDSQPCASGSKRMFKTKLYFMYVSDSTKIDVASIDDVILSVDRNGTTFYTNGYVNFFSEPTVKYSNVELVRGTLVKVSLRMTQTGLLANFVDTTSFPKLIDIVDKNKDTSEHARHVYNIVSRRITEMLDREIAEKFTNDLFSYLDDNPVHEYV